MDKKRIIAVVGPTASGKSALALELAGQCNGEIVSCDSMQIYKRMSIGTAKPTVDELSSVRHHLIDVVEPTDNFSCEDYVRLASAAIDDICARGKLPIVCGGTGLYLDALLRGGVSAPSIDTSTIRAELCARAELEGIMPIYEQLRSVDPESAEAIHPNNEKRVIRALEIYLVSGKTKTEWDKENTRGTLKEGAEIYVLTSSDREALYKRIDTRVDLMLEAGLLEEVKNLALDPATTAGQAIGYKELNGYFAGQVTLDEAVDKIKQASRNYAKRQLTWWERNSHAVKIDIKRS